MTRRFHCLLHNIFNSFKSDSLRNTFCHLLEARQRAIWLPGQSVSRRTGSRTVLFSNACTFGIGSGPSGNIDFAIRHQEVQHGGGHDEDLQNNN